MRRSWGRSALPSVRVVSADAETAARSSWAPHPPRMSAESERLGRVIGQARSSVLGDVANQPTCCPEGISLIDRLSTLGGWDALHVRFAPDGVPHGATGSGHGRGVVVAMADFIQAARLVDVPPGTGTVVTVAATEVALFNVGGTIYATDNSCLHQGGSLGTSDLEGHVVTCRGHGWRYDVRTGHVLHVPDYGVATYPVKVTDGQIMVAVP